MAASHSLKKSLANQNKLFFKGGPMAYMSRKKAYRILRKLLKKKKKK